MEAKKKTYRVYTLNNFEKLPQIQQHLSPLEQNAIKVVGNVLPFKANNYVVDELIDWSNLPDDPIFQLTFPQRGMLSDEHFSMMEQTLESNPDRKTLREAADSIRFELNPHPAGQMELNVPTIEGVQLTGVQHKYRETVLFFPSHSQTCHAYCTFCFRWPQFVGIDELKFAMREVELLVKYLQAHPEVTDVLFTGGDPMVMKTDRLRSYIEPLLEADLPNLRSIRIGTKSLSYWPYRFTEGEDADDTLRLFEKVVKSGIHLAFMAHFNHPVELQTPAVQEAIRRIRDTGAEIRSQSPIMRHINDSAEAWSEMWQTQVNLGIVPYYMFMARDTGAQDYFAVTLEDAWKTFRRAYQSVSGLSRSVRGPSMSAGPGKVQVLGVSEVAGQRVFVLRFLQGRNPEWVGRPFFARYDPQAIWLDDLEPAFGESHFFFDRESVEYNLN